MFQSYLGHKNEFSAAVVFAHTEAQQVFVADESLYLTNGWSAWVAPTFISADANATYKLLSGSTVASKSEAPVKAFARFKLGSYVQWSDETAEMKAINSTSDLEPCP